MSEVRRIALWSGPRNISTALMRSWSQRPDTFVCDEPLYAHYLKSTGSPHPGADEVIRAHKSDWQKVVAWLTEFEPAGKRVFYQKQMAHHLLLEIGREWLDRVTNAFLIREPREMITSYLRVRGEVSLEETGYPQQLEIFDRVRQQTGLTPPVIDARDVLNDPGRLLRLLCESLDLEFTEAMLTWPPGPRETDGVWARHWYDAVNRSTGFQPFQPKPDSIPAHLMPVLDKAEAIYAQLHAHRLGQ